MALELSKHCREKVTEARTKNLHTHIFAGQQHLTTTKNGGGTLVEAMALHPGGLMVIFGGKRYVVDYDYVVLAEE